MRFRTIVLLIVAAVASSTALAAGAPRDPSSLILRKADLGRGADYDSSTDDGVGIQDALAARGLRVRAASYLGVTFSKRKGALQVSGAVWTPAGAADAKTVFAVAKKERAAFWKTAHDGRRTITVRPAYGDAQVARYDPAGREGIAVMELLVRRNAVVWMLGVNLERRPAIPTRAEALRQLETYAAKQKRRVGAG